MPRIITSSRDFAIVTADPTATRVGLRFAADKNAQALKKFQRAEAKAVKASDQLPRLLKTYDRQSRGYKTTNPVKATATLKKIIAKVESIGKEYQKAFDLAEAFDKSYLPTTQEKKGYYTDFKDWLGKMDKALTALRKAIREVDPETEWYDLHLSRFDPTQRSFGGGYDHIPLASVKNTASSVEMYWGWLNRPDPDPILIPKGGNDLERFMAFLTPTVKKLAKAAAAKIKKDKAKAAVLVSAVLEDVNAHKESAAADAILAPLNQDDSASWEGISTIMSNVAGDLGYDVITSGAFGVALLQIVGAGAYADQLAKSLAASYAEYTKD
jgi:hypothetical protein